MGVYSLHSWVCRHKLSGGGARLLRILVAASLANADVSTDESDMNIIECLVVQVVV